MAERAPEKREVTGSTPVPTTAEVLVRGCDALPRSVPSGPLRRAHYVPKRIPRTDAVAALEQLPDPEEADAGAVVTGTLPASATGGREAVGTLSREAPQDPSCNLYRFLYS